MITPTPYTIEKNKDSIKAYKSGKFIGETTALAGLEALLQKIWVDEGSKVGQSYELDGINVFLINIETL